MSYGEIREKLIELHPGWTYDTVDDMSFEQIDLAIAGGKRTRDIPVSSAGEVREIARDWRQWYGV
jgi:hypothetical protein